MVIHDTEYSCMVNSLLFNRVSQAAHSHAVSPSHKTHKINSHLETKHSNSIAKIVKEKAKKNLVKSF